MAKQRNGKATMKKAGGSLALFALIAALSFLVVQLLRRRQATPKPAPVTTARQVKPAQMPTPASASSQTTERQTSNNSSRPTTPTQTAVAPARQATTTQAPAAPPLVPASEDEVRETVLAVLEEDDGIPTTSLEAAFVEALQEPEEMATQAAPKTTAHQPFVGNHRTLIYHPAHSVHLPSAENSRFFTSEEEAVQAGFRRAEGE